MTVKVDKRSQWHDPNFQPNEGPARDFDQFAPIDSRGFGLRGFIEQELQTRSASSTGGTNVTLVPGRIYLRQLPDRSWELLVYRGRSAYDVHTSESREDLIQLAEDLKNQKVG